MEAIKHPCESFQGNDWKDGKIYNKIRSPVCYVG